MPYPGFKLQSTPTSNLHPHSNFLLRLFASVPLRLYAHSPFPIAHNNVDDAVASFITLLAKRHLPSVGHHSFLGYLSILINCFCHLGLIDSAFSALSKIIKLGHDLNVITLTTLMKEFRINNKVREALVSEH
ncbi:hypothetical protein HN51_048061 [Arachis hypogaea]